MDTLILAGWSTSIALMLYALLRGKYELFSTWLVVFFILLIPILMMLNRPNPDHIRLVPVAIESLK